MNFFLVQVSVQLLSWSVLQILHHTIKISKSNGQSIITWGGGAHPSNRMWKILTHPIRLHNGAYATATFEKKIAIVTSRSADCRLSCRLSFAKCTQSLAEVRMSGVCT